MAKLLKQSTSVVISFGPFVDYSDGVTPVTGLVSALDNGTTGIKLSKNGGTLTIRHATVTASEYDAHGMYKVTLDTTDTGTLGKLRVVYTDAATIVPVWEDFEVVTANVYDSLFSTDKLQVDVTELNGTSQTAGTDLGVAIPDLDAEVDDIHAVVHSIAVTGSALHQEAFGYTIASDGGTVTSGTLADTAIANGTSHVIQAEGSGGTAKLDVEYRFNIGTGSPVRVNVVGALKKAPGAGIEQVSLDAYRWDTNQYEVIHTNVFVGATADPPVLVTHSDILLSRHVGTGANLGEVKVRFYDQALEGTTTYLYVDQVTVEYAQSFAAALATYGVALEATLGTPAGDSIAEDIAGVAAQIGTPVGADISADIAGVPDAVDANMGIHRKFAHLMARDCVRVPPSITDVSATPALVEGESIEVWSWNLRDAGWNANGVNMDQNDPTVMLKVGTLDHTGWTFDENWTQEDAGLIFVAFPTGLGDGKSVTLLVESELPDMTWRRVVLDNACLLMLKNGTVLGRENNLFQSRTTEFMDAMVDGLFDLGIAQQGTVEGIPNAMREFSTAVAATADTVGAQWEAAAAGGAGVEQIIYDAIDEAGLARQSTLDQVIAAGVAIADPVGIGTASQVLVSSMFEEVRAVLRDEKQKMYPDFLMVPLVNRAISEINYVLIQLGADICMGQLSIVGDGTSQNFALPSDFKAFVPKQVRPRSPISATSNYSHGVALEHTDALHQSMVVLSSTVSVPRRFKIFTDGSYQYIRFDCIPEAGATFDCLYYKAPQRYTVSSVYDTYTPWLGLLDDLIQRTLEQYCREGIEFTTEARAAWRERAEADATMLLGLRHTQSQTADPSSWKGLPT